MKKINFKMFGAMLTMSLAFVLASCSDSVVSEGNEEKGSEEIAVPQVKYAPKKVALSSRQKCTVEVTNTFALNFFKNLSASEEFAEKNVFSSPLGVAFVMGIMLNGANGATALEIAKVYGYEITDESTLAQAVSDINELAKKLYTELPVLDDSLKFSMSSKVSCGLKDGALPSFSDIVADNFGAVVHNYDGEEKYDSICNVVSEWKKEHPNEDVPQSLLSERYWAALFHALYIENDIDFEGKWLCPFKEENTTEMAFTTENNVSIKTPMMNGESTLIDGNRYSFKYAENDVFKTLSMYYGNGSYSMVMLLPNQGKKVSDVLNSLTAETWKSNIESLKDRHVTVCIPKFEQNSALCLNEIFEGLGVSTAFKKSSDFTKACARWKDADHDIQKRMSLFQGAEIKIDEGGTVAKAITMSNGETAANLSPLCEFIADHPFVYAIVENSTGAICFMGKYMGEE